MPKKFFVTTAIDYVNGSPHLGHAYEKILADFFARSHRSVGHDVFFLTGVDEHGQKVQQSARKAGEDPKVFCDRSTAKFKSLHEKLSISSSLFVRTTEESHKKVVAHFLQHLFDKGEIFFQEHEGMYSERQEQFVTEKDMVDGKWPEIFGEVVHRKEANYFFKLEPYRERLTAYYLSHQDFIVPSFRANEVLSALGAPLEALCISRPKTRLEWGIPLPFDENYVTFVWFDALINYFSFSHIDGPKHWPPQLQIIGKDILVPPHGIYWPIILMAMGHELPENILVHGFWTTRGTKISKSDPGSIVDPVPYVEIFGADALRYFVLSEIATGHDADFSDERFEVGYTTKLLNGLGNLVNRVMVMLEKYCQSIVPAYDDADVTSAEVELRSDEVIVDYYQAILEYSPQHALQAIWRLIDAGNGYIQKEKPFEIVKDPAQMKRLQVVLGHLVETIRRLSILIEPALPNTAVRLRKQLNWSLAHGKLETAKFGKTMAGHLLGTTDKLFLPFDVLKENAGLPKSEPPPQN